MYNDLWSLLIQVFLFFVILGAAWRDVGENKDRKAFSSVLEMVRQVSTGINGCEEDIIVS